MQFHSYFWLIPFFSFFLGYFSIAYFYQSPPCQTPSLVGASLHDAVLQTSGLNLNLRIIGCKQDADLPSGTIISQMPQPKSKVKSNQFIYCVVSEQPETPLMPNFLKKHKDIVIEELNKKSLRFKIFYTESLLPIDTCVAQWPNAGMQLDNSPIIIYLSAGNNKPIIWPDFKGIPITDVQEFLEIHGIAPTINHTVLLEPGHICQDNCIIVDQRPLPGSIITITSTKNLQSQLQVSLKKH